MSCPTCDHTLAGIGHGMWHCGRCGTLKLCDGGYAVPALVGRCRDFDAYLFGQRIRQIWAKLGIAEAMQPPESRDAHCPKEGRQP